jgi:hypothetical protein
MECIRLWLSALGTPMIAAVGLWIAYQQYNLQQYRLKHDVSERRYAMLSAAEDLIHAAVTATRTPEDAFTRFRAATVGASFLFRQDITSYLNCLRARYARMLEIEDIRADKGFANCEDQKRQLAELGQHRQAMRDEKDMIEARFRPYFDLSIV